LGFLGFLKNLGFLKPNSTALHSTADDVNQSASLAVLPFCVIGFVRCSV